MPTLESERLLSARSTTSPSQKPKSVSRSRATFDFSVFKGPTPARRPKSTPAQFSAAKSSPNAGRPHTSVGAGAESEGCERVMQVLREPVRKHNLTSSLPLKRHSAKSPSPAAATADGIPSCFQVGPGYVMYRSKSRISMNINSNEFWGKEEKPGDRSPSGKKAEDYKDVLIAKLQDQINDLKLFLEEEKLNHRDTIQRCAEDLRVRLQQIHAEHAEEMRQNAEAHEREIAELRSSFEAELLKMKEEAEELENKLRQDIDFLHASFESYKSALSVEVQDRLKEREAQLRLEFDLELKKYAEELRLAFNREKVAERSKWEQEHQREVERMRRDHRKEMDTLGRKFAEAQELLLKLEDTTERLNKQTSAFEALKEAHEFLKEEKQNLTLQIKETEAELQKTLQKLRRLEDSFEERVRLVDEKYRLQIEGLKHQSVDLRRAYMTKCSELVEEKTKNDIEMLDRLETAKDAIRTVVTARSRAAMSIAALDEEEADRERKGFLRPLSAPTTAEERETARDCAGETTSGK